MRSRLRLGVLIPVFLLLTLPLAACEKDRPIPTPQGATPQPLGTQALALTPEAAITRVALPTGTGRGAGSPAPLATPAPLAPGGSAVPSPKPATTIVSSGGQSPGARTDQFFTYKVQLGDTLGDIAKKFGVTAEAIVALNSLANPDVLMVGQELKIPGQAASGQATSGRTGTGVYVVRRGDTLSSIARRFGVSLADLQTLNDIANPDQITVGQQLRIPTSTGITSAPSQSRTYVVQRGDTLVSIALRFGVTVAALQSANSISDPNKVYPGQTLKIP